MEAANTDVLAVKRTQKSHCPRPAKKDISTCYKCSMEAEEMEQNIQGHHEVLADTCGHDEGILSDLSQKAHPRIYASTLQSGILDPKYDILIADLRLPHYVLVISMSVL